MLVLDWGMNVYKMVKFTPVDRRLFVSCVDLLLNYVARKLSFNYEKKTFNKQKRTQNLYYKCFVGYFWKLEKEKCSHTPRPWHSWNLSHYYFTMFHICRTTRRHFPLRQVKLSKRPASEFALAHLTPISHCAK